MKTCKHCWPVTSIPLSSTSLAQSSDFTSGSTRTALSLGNKARLLAIPASSVSLATLANFDPTSSDDTPSARAVSELKVVKGVSVGLFDGVVLGKSEGCTEGILLGTLDGVVLGTLVGLKLGIFDGTVVELSLVTE